MSVGQFGQFGQFGQPGQPGLSAADGSGENLAGPAPRGGTLSEAGRLAAIGSALHLLGQYFASGGQPLIAQNALAQRESGAADPEMTVLLGGLRLRVALAAAGRLRSILARIVARATFRYQVEPTESTGAVTGQLDVNRYVATLGLRGDVVSYPVLDVRRAGQTPENVLAAYAARWLLKELRVAHAAGNVPVNGPEHELYRAEFRELQSLLRLPALAACREEAERVNRRRAERDLVAAVRRRLRRREIANATPYGELADWVGRVLDGQPVAEPGDVAWSFYGDRFDTKLFELWCLHFLAAEISRHLVSPMPTLRRNWRTGGAAYVWPQYAGTLSLHFQRSITSISGQHPARWRREDGTPLGGIPDMVVRADPRGAPGAPRFAAVDPKLRQRDGAPVEELYKVLGYLDNFGLSADPHAAILYYRDGGNSLSSYRYRPSHGPGDLFAVRLDPAQPEASRAGIAQLAISILGLLGIPSLAAVAADKGDAEGGPQGAADPEAFYRAKKAELAAYTATVPAGLLNVSRQRMRVDLGDTRWNALAAPVQAMLSTADHLGFTLLAGADPADPEGMDFSGPVIGVCASIESLVHEAVVTPAVAHEPDLAEKLERATFGAVVALIEQAVQGVKNPRPEHVAIRARLLGNAFDTERLAGLLPLLRQVNQRFRTRAAHREVVRDVDWAALWTTVMKEDLLADVIDVLMRLPPGQAHDAAVTAQPQGR